jgi:hypothetical protein
MKESTTNQPHTKKRLSLWPLTPEEALRKALNTPSPGRKAKESREPEK